MSRAAQLTFSISSHKKRRNNLRVFLKTFGERDTSPYPLILRVVHPIRRGALRFPTLQNWQARALYATPRGPFSVPHSPRNSSNHTFPLRRLHLRENKENIRENIREQLPVINPQKLLRIRAESTNPTLGNLGTTAVMCVWSLSVCRLHCHHHHHHHHHCRRRPSSPRAPVLILSLSLALSLSLSHTHTHSHTTSTARAREDKD